MSLARAGHALTLRPARAADARPIATILSNFIDETPWMPRLHSRADDLGFCCRMVDRGGVTVAVADRVVGFLFRRGETVEALYVDGGWRGRGVGSALLEAAKAECPRLDLWTFAENAGARAFYARHGFAEIARTDGSSNAESLPDIQYLWEAPQP